MITFMSWSGQLLLFHSGQGRIYSWVATNFSWLLRSKCFTVSLLWLKSALFFLGEGSPVSRWPISLSLNATVSCTRSQYTQGLLSVYALCGRLYVMLRSSATTALAKRGNWGTDIGEESGGQKPEWMNRSKQNNVKNICPLKGRLEDRENRKKHKTQTEADSYSRVERRNQKGKRKRQQAVVAHKIVRRRGSHIF
jgi:hypothetical protein